MCRVTCAHCHDSFLFNTLNNALARCIYIFILYRQHPQQSLCLGEPPFNLHCFQDCCLRCPHCRKVSSVGPEFARTRLTCLLFFEKVVNPIFIPLKNRSIIFLIFGLIVLGIGIGITGKNIIDFPSSGHSTDSPHLQWGPCTTWRRRGGCTSSTSAPSWWPPSSSSAASTTAS